MQANQNNNTSSKLIWGFIPLWFIQLAVVGIVGFLVYYLFIRVPKEGKTVKVEDENGDGKPDLFNPTYYTNALEADLIGLNISGHDTALHTEILAMSDGKIEAICEDWNKRIAPKMKGESLPKAIADEIGVPFSDFATLKELYANKFKKLSLY